MTAPRRFAVYPGAAAIPADVLAWAQREATAHEEEWGFDDEVTISWPLCGWRGPVGMHIDSDSGDDELIVGLILEGDGHRLICGVTDQELPLPVGALYVLDPKARHGTMGPRDDRILFITDSIDVDCTTEPAALAQRLLDDAQRCAATRRPIERSMS